MTIRHYSGNWQKIGKVTEGDKNSSRAAFAAEKFLDLLDQFQRAEGF